MQPDSDDDAWRSIVENYGDRAELDPDDPHVVPLAPEPVVEPLTWRAEAAPREEPDPDRFVPPPPPPVPHTTPDRLAAWLGVFGAPAVLLVALVLGVSLPGWLGYLLVGAFVGGFLYLVVQMPRGPRDPGDDGARL